MFVALLRKLLRLRLILASCNSMVPFKIFGKVTHWLVCMQQAKLLFDELVIAGHPMSLGDFNLYMFCGLSGKFKHLVTSFITKVEPLSYADLHNYFLTHEFLHKNSLHSMMSLFLCCLHLCCRSHHHYQHHSPLLILLCLITA